MKSWRERGTLGSESMGERKSGMQVSRDTGNRLLFACALLIITTVGCREIRDSYYSTPTVCPALQGDSRPDIPMYDGPCSTDEGEYVIMTANQWARVSLPQEVVSIRITSTSGQLYANLRPEERNAIVSTGRYQTSGVVEFLDDGDNVVCYFRVEEPPSVRK